MKKILLLFMTICLCSTALMAQEDSVTWIPRSLDVAISAAPAYALSSSEGGMSPAIYPSLATAPLIQADLLWDAFLSYRAGYGFQRFETAYNASIADQTIRSGRGSIGMHAAHIAIGQAQYFNLSKTKDDFAFVITPWIGLRTGFLQSFITPNQRSEIDAIDTVINQNASYHIFESDSITGYSLQRLEKGDFLQWQMMLSLSFEFRIIDRLHLGAEPFVCFGFQPMFRQFIDYADYAAGFKGQQVLISRGSNYGIRFSIRYALWQAAY